MLLAEKKFVQRPMTPLPPGTGTSEPRTVYTRMEKESLVTCYKMTKKRDLIYLFGGLFVLWLIESRLATVLGFSTTNEKASH